MKSEYGFIELQKICTPFIKPSLFIYLHKIVRVRAFLQAKFTILHFPLTFKERLGDAVLDILKKNTSCDISLKMILISATQISRWVDRSLSFPLHLQWCWIFLWGIIRLVLLQLFPCYRLKKQNYFSVTICKIFVFPTNIIPLITKYLINCINWTQIEIFHGS